MRRVWRLVGEGDLRMDGRHLAQYGSELSSEDFAKETLGQYRDRGRKDMKLQTREVTEWEDVE